MHTFLEKAKNASRIIATLEPRIKDALLHQMAQILEDNSVEICEENAKDLKEAHEKYLKKVYNFYR